MNNTDALLEKWESNAKRSKVAHYKTAAHYSNLHFWFGIPVVVVTTIVGTSVFATLENDTNTYIQILVGLFSILSAVLAALHTFFNFSDFKINHRNAASKYGAIHREIEELRLIDNIDSNELLSRISDIRSKMDELAQNTIDTPKRIWKIAEREVPPIMNA